MEKISALLKNFHAVSLDEIDEVKLMNRIDRKYWFHISLLEKLLTKVVEDYDILEINGNRLMKYQSAYYDTAAVYWQAPDVAGTCNITVNVSDCEYSDEYTFSVNVEQPEEEPPPTVGVYYYYYYYYYVII